MHSSFLIRGNLEYLSVSGATTLVTPLPPCVSLRFVLLRVLTEKPVQSIKDNHTLLQQFAIVSEHFTEPVNGCVEPSSFQSMKLVVFEIYVVNYFSYLTQTFATAQAEPFQQRLEGAILVMMGELSAIHVERNRSLYRLALCNKVEARAFVDELFD